MNKLFLITIFICYCTIIFSQTPKWLWAVDPYDANAHGRAIVTDENGYSYVTGVFSSAQAVFDTIVLSSNSYNQQAAFIVKYDTAGNVIWAKDFRNVNPAGSMPWLSGWGISLDKSGNCYTTGTIPDTSIIDSVIVYPHDFGNDIYVTKHSTSGNFKWVRREGGPYDDIPAGIVSDSIGNSYVAAYFSTETIIGNDTIPGKGFTDIIIYSYDPNGNLRWYKHTGGSFGDKTSCIALSSDNNFYVTGLFRSTVIFGHDTLTSLGFTDMFVAKMDTLGNYLWIKQIGGTNAMTSHSVSCDKWGNVYATGKFSDTTYIDNTVLYGTGIFIVKYDSSGNFQWVRNEVNSNQSSSEATGISTDDNGNSYITGICNDTIVLNNDTIFGSGLYVIKLDLSGDLIWQLRSEHGGIGSAIHADNSGHCYVTGFYIHNLVLDSIIDLHCNVDNVFTGKIVCYGQPSDISIVNGFLSSSTASYYQWFLNGSQISGANSQNYFPLQNGFYVVLTYDTNGCIAYSDPFLFEGVGIAELFNGKSITVFPNPSFEFFNFDVEDFEKIIIRDLMGKEILSSTKSIIDLKNYTSGIYYYSVSTKSGMLFTGKLIKY